MKSQDLFGLVVRAMGLFETVYGVNYAQGFFIPDQEYIAADYFVPTIFHLGVGLILLFCADFIVAAAYRNRAPESSNSAETGSPDSADSGLD